MTDVRVVQISDTHLSASEPVGPGWTSLTTWLAADPPDLVVHTGDIVLVDPDDDDDRAFAHDLVTALPAAVRVIPGNHDVGPYGEGAMLPRRLAQFRATWGDDTFVVDIGGWRLVGANSYRFGEADHDCWLTEAVDVDGPVALFVHQPLGGDATDGWQMPTDSLAAARRALAAADIRVIASGHRHAALTAVTERWVTVWCPSTRFLGNGATTLPNATVELTTGVVEHHFAADGTHRSAVVRLSSQGPCHLVPGTS